MRSQIRTGVFGPVFLHSGCGCGNADLSIYSKALLFWKCVAATPVQMFELMSDICDGRFMIVFKVKESIFKKTTTKKNIVLCVSGKTCEIYWHIFPPRFLPSATENCSPTQFLGNLCGI